ncbi:hypothetical protein FRX31_019411 [Thalictrum thalictroides]|uniref:DUF3741 domain-containing protein n=1 Tax=Thalictrum thalictroides TaxID=46969 RepID=A0A7J6W3A4_THATH|nr:hypothetical protein FRX31_019411 [Thalictrum thalictroides]
MKINFTSSSSTSSFDANLCNSHNASTVKRFSTVLRRFLCSGSLRAHPFDCVKHVDGIAVESDHLEIVEKLEQGSVMTPGIVARLMGLETMPEFNSKDSIGRSRSVNSVDFWSEFDQNQSQHRRVKSSLSFREMPSFLEEEDDKFFVLSFENVRKTKAKKPEKNSAELKQRRVSGNKNKENRRDKKMEGKKVDSRKNCSNRTTLNNSNIDKMNHSSSNSSHHKKDHTQPHASTKPRNPLDGIKLLLVETKSKCTTKETENSSPVSVLDLIGYTSESESLLSEEDLRLKGLNSRRKLSSELANSENHSSNYSHNVVTEVAESLISSKVAKSTRMDCHTEDYLELWGQICMLTEEDSKTSNWITREISKMEDFEAIRMEYSVQIVDQLLHELVVEMAN